MLEKTNNTETMLRNDTVLYKNSELPINIRVSDLLNRMTLEEKVAQMICVWGQKKTMIMDEEGNLDLSRLHENFGNGMGQIARLSDTANGLGAVAMAELANTLQKFFIEETRLGIPVIFHEECLHGMAGKEATSFPQPIGLASTFNPDLIEEIYTSVAKDVRMRGAHQALTPVVDVARDARWGRVEETFGEDPYLVSQMGVAAVKGFQGDATFKNKDRIIATLKHFAAHGQPESGTNCAPVNISERLLRDTFLFPFKEAIEKGNALSVMASYNEIDGVPSHANKWLLRTVLREEWGFKGYVVSDYYAVTELNYREEAISHSVAKDKFEAARIAVETGVNMETPDPDCYPNLVQLVQEGKVKESLLDELVAPLLKYKFVLGLFDDPYVDIEAIKINEKLENDRPLALQAAHETMVLLKNQDNILPLNIKKKSTLAVIGPNANRKLLGGYSGEPKYFTSVLEGIKEKVGDSLNVIYSEGCKLTAGGTWNDDEIIFPDPKDNERLIEEALVIAKEADTIILVIGGNEQTSREAWNKSHMGDRANVDLFGVQNELVTKIVALGKPVIAVLFNGRPNSISILEENVQAILECWYLGQECGNAVANVLFGNVNPSGKLPMSFPRSVGHIPCYYNYKPSARRGYLCDDVTPLYSFGYGLSFTKFSFSNLRLEKEKINNGDSVHVYIDLKNDGKMAGQEVVQLYIRDVVSSVTRPVKELKGFQKIGLKPGEIKTITFTISSAELAFTNIDKEFVVEPGEFEIMVGNSSKDEDLQKVVLQVV